MNCSFCNDTGKYKKPNNQDEFDRIVDSEIEKAYFVNYDMARKKAYKQVGYTLIDCPYCNKEQ